MRDDGSQKNDVKLPGGELGKDIEKEFEDGAEMSK